MSTTKHTGQAADQIVDSLIEQHFEEACEAEENGSRIAPFSAADKLHMANRAGVDLEVVERRMQALCEELPHIDRFAAVPRYRYKASDEAASSDDDACGR